MLRVVAGAAAVVTMLAFAACSDTPAGDSDGGSQVAITVAPLDLPDLGDACYSLSVTNGDGAVVWSRAGICADQFGDGASSISYVGTCDASDGVRQNTVALVVEALYGEGGAPLAAGSWQDPTAQGPLERTITCEANADVAVAFNLTILRAAQQGFFDVAVTFDDLFCSAKLDCEDEDNNTIELLFNDATHEREATAVLAFTCTAGEGTDTHLHMSDVTVSCGGADYVIDPTGGPGNLSNDVDPVVPNPALFEAAVFRGEEQLGAWSKRYWNVALGLAAVTGCRLTAAATASDGPFTDGQTPADTSWPYIDFNTTFDSCTRHALNDPDGVVETRYTSLAGKSFANYFSAAGIFGAAPWWDLDWTYQQELGITAGASALTADSTLFVTIDHADLVAQGRSLASGDDLRVVHWDGVAWNEIDRVPLTAWNGSAVEIAFSPVAPIAAGETDLNYALAYGNPSPTADPLANGRNIYWLWEDFDDGDFTSGNAWTANHGSWSVENDYAKLVNPTGADNFEAGLYYPGGATWTDYVVTMRLRDASTGGQSYPGPALRVGNPATNNTSLWWFEYSRNVLGATMRPFVNNNDYSWAYNVDLPAPFASNAWVDLRYQIVGSQIWSWYEGTAVHAATTVSAPHRVNQGSIALGAHNGYPAPQEFHYDDVRVWKYLPNPPAVSQGDVTTR